MNRCKVLLVVASALVVLTLGGAGIFIVWANDASQPMPEALAALKRDD